VTFYQDASWIRAGHGPEHRAVLQHLCLNLLNELILKPEFGNKKSQYYARHNFSLKAPLGQDTYSKEGRTVELEVIKRKSHILNPSRNVGRK
jgi:hypothetical protein